MEEESDQFVLQKDEEGLFGHSLTIAEDRDRVLRTGGRKRRPYFEWLVDALPIEPVLEERPDLSFYPFSIGEREFYVGYDPDQGTTFEGILHRLVFDPNSSCNPCVG